VNSELENPEKDSLPKHRAFLRTDPLKEPKPILNECNAELGNDNDEASTGESAGNARDHGRICLVTWLHGWRGQNE